MYICIMILTLRTYIHAYVGHSAVPLSSTTTKSSKKYVCYCM